jgi:hypothetical protein
MGAVIMNKPMCSSLQAFSHVHVKRAFGWGAAASVVALAACGDGGFSGKSYGGDDCFFETIEFTSDDAGYISQFGIQSQFSYTVDDDRVIVTVGSDNAVFTVDDDGALDGGTLLGKCTELS